MAVLWLCWKPGVSQCPAWHNKAKPKSVACRSDHKPNEVLEVGTVEVDKKDESREAVELADDA